LYENKYIQGGLEKILLETMDSFVVNSNCAARRLLSTTDTDSVNSLISWNNAWVSILRKYREDAI